MTKIFLTLLMGKLPQIAAIGAVADSVFEQLFFGNEPLRIGDLFDAAIYCPCRSSITCTKWLACIRLA